MQAHSERLTRAILGAVRITPLVDWSPGRGAPWSPLQPLTGSHTQDRTSQTRWTFSGTFARSVPVGEEGLHAYGCRVRIRMAVHLLRSAPEIVAAGVYTVGSVSLARTNIQLTGASFEQEVIDSTLPVPRTLPPGFGYTYRTQAEELIREAVPDAVFDWDARLDHGQAMPQYQADADRWAVVSGAKDASSIAGAMGAEAYCDASGTFRFVRVPDLYEPAVDQVARGRALIEDALFYDRENVRNLLVITGTPSDGSSVVGPVFVWDSDPNSLTYAGPDPVSRPELAGPYGVKPIRYDSPLITNVYQAYRAGQAKLADDIGLHKTLAFTSRYNPCWEAGDVVEAESEDGRWGRYLLDAIQYNWASGAAVLTTRSPKAAKSNG